MATRRKEEPRSHPRRPPATTPEARENQLVAAAMDEAEKQIREGTASSQIITHFLKLGSTRDQLEKDRLAQENELLKAKIEAMASSKRVEELYETALNAMRFYAGYEPQESFDD